MWSGDVQIKFKFKITLLIPYMNQWEVVILYYPRQAEEACCPGMLPFSDIYSNGTLLTYTWQWPVSVTTVEYVGHGHGERGWRFYDYMRPRFLDYLVDGFLITWLTDLPIRQHKGRWQNKMMSKFWFNPPVAFSTQTKNKSNGTRPIKTHIVQ